MYVGHRADRPELLTVSWGSWVRVGILALGDAQLELVEQLGVHTVGAVGAAAVINNGSDDLGQGGGAGLALEAGRLRPAL